MKKKICFFSFLLPFLSMMAIFIGNGIFDFRLYFVDNTSGIIKPVESPNTHNFPAKTCKHIGL